jgi:hypothetical protein
VTDVDLLNVGLSAAIGGVMAAFVLRVLGGLTFWAMDLIRALWSGRE